MRCFPPQLPPVSRYLLFGGQGHHQGAHYPPHLHYSGFSGGSAGKASTFSGGDLGWEDPLEKEMATHSSLLAWRIPRTEESGGLQSMRSQRVGHD